MAPFTVLHVCMGNICRSPMAERLLAARCVPAAAR
jgi:protein-tyrosine phosphatase